MIVLLSFSSYSNASTIHNSTFYSLHLDIFFEQVHSHYVPLHFLRSFLNVDGTADDKNVNL